MNVDRFWKIIDEARAEAGGWEEMDGPLQDLLTELELDDLLLWAHIFDEYQRLSYKSKLWAAAYVINGGCGDDGFDYFRAWLTAQGREVFHEALRDPDCLAEVSSCEGDVEFEDLLGAAATAFFTNMDRGRDYDLYQTELERRPLPQAVQDEMSAGIDYAADIDVQWDEDEGLDELLPKLCGAFEW